MKVRRNDQETEIPTSSMADIAFLLIIFFMVTTAFSATKGLEFKLPEEEEETKAVEEEEAVYVHIRPDLAFEVDGKEMAAEDILVYLKPKLLNNVNKAVIIHPDPASPYEGMVTVLDVLRRGVPLEPGEWPAGVELPTEDWVPPQIQKDGLDRYYVRVRNIAIPTIREINQYIELFGYNPFAVGS